jgi:hypothetical protein
MEQIGIKWDIAEMQKYTKIIINNNTYCTTHGA